jgi:hypothetical protein
MRHTLFIALLSVFLFTSCSSNPTITVAPVSTVRFSPPTSNPSPTPIPTFTPTPTPTPTQRLHVVLEKDTALYDGPGNEGYGNIALIKAGTEVNPLGSYVDFVKAEISADGKNQTGFIVKSALGRLPSEIPELNVNEVPWQPIDVFNSFADSQSSLQGSSIIIDNTASGFSDIQGSPVTLDSAFKLSFELDTSDRKFGSLKLTDKDYNKSGPYWQGIQRIDFAIMNGKLQIGINDGTVQDGPVFPLNIHSAQVITVTFTDPHGKKLNVSDQNGREIQSIDMAAVAGVNLKEGLFPQGEARFGSVTSPESRLTIGSFAVQKLPSGKWITSTAATNQPTLRQLGKQQGISIGTWVRLDLLRTCLKIQFRS